MMDDRPFAELKRHRVTAESMAIVEPAVVPWKIQKRRQQFVKVPWTWVERLTGARGHAVIVALHILYL